jgi:hypothetical protein
MNPAFLNYLQSQEGTPQVDSNTQGTTQPYNPFNAGIKNAIESARMSLGMTDKQQDKAMRRSLLTFANENAAQPKQRGFLGNLASIGKAIGPAVAEHDDYEYAMERDNNALANQILAYNAAEQERIARDEERQWKKQLAQEQMSEQKRYHDLMMAAKMQKLNAERDKLSQPDSVAIGENEYIPITTKKEYGDYVKSKNAFGHVLNDLTEIEKEYGKFRKDYKDNLLDPMSPTRKYTNKGKDLIGRFFNNKSLLQESADRKNLNSQLQQFIISSERQLKGGGVMGPRLIELFKEMDIYPNLDTDTPLEFETKLKRMKDETEHFYNASVLSLQNKAHIDPYELRNLEQEQENISSTLKPTNTEITFPPNLEIVKNKQGEDSIIMLDTEGEEFYIPLDQIEIAKERKFTFKK